MKEHHQLTRRTVGTIVELTWKIFQEQLTEKEIQQFLDKVGWREKEPEIWLRNSEDAALAELVTILLTALGWPFGNKSLLDSLDGKMNLDGRYPKVPGPDVPLGEDSVPLSDYPQESATSDQDAPAAADPKFQAFVTAVRQIEEAMIRLKIVTPDQVFEARRESERMLRSKLSGEAVKTVS